MIPFFTQAVQTMKLFKSNQVETCLLDILYNQKSKAPIKTSAVRALLVLYSATNLLANEQERVCTLLNEKGFQDNLLHLLRVEACCIDVFFF